MQPGSPGVTDEFKASCLVMSRQQSDLISIYNVCGTRDVRITWIAPNGGSYTISYEISGRRESDVPPRGL